MKFRKNTAPQKFRKKLNQHEVRTRGDFSSRSLCGFLAKFLEELTVRKVDSVLVVDLDGFRVQLERLLIVALLEFFVAKSLQNVSRA